MEVWKETTIQLNYKVSVCFVKGHSWIESNNISKNVYFISSILKNLVLVVSSSNFQCFSEFIIVSEHVKHLSGSEEKGMKNDC